MKQPAHITNDKLGLIFPFYLIFDKSLFITEAGPALKKIFPKIINTSFQEFFKIKRPFSTGYQFNSLLEYAQQIFILENIESAILFKGQIIHLEHKESIMFIGSPWLTKVEDMEKKQILITDFALHDTTPDMLQVLKSQEIVMDDIHKLVEELNHQKKELVESEKRLGLQYSISQVLASSPILEEAMTKVIEVVCNTIGWKCGSFWIPQNELGILKCVSYWQNTMIPDHEFENLTRDTTFTQGIGLPGRVWKTNKFAWIADVTKDLNFPRAAVASKFNLHGAFGFPIFIDNTVLGVVEFFSDQVAEPDIKLVQMFEASANQLIQFIQKVKANTILKESEKQYKQLVEEASDIIYRTNYKGFFVYVNPIAMRILKMTEKEIIGRHFTALVRPDYRKQTEEFYKEQFIKRIPITYYEFPAVNGNNEDVWIGQNVKLVFESGRISGFHAVTRDITERKRFELELLKAKELAENSKKAKEQFLANMSHEIRTPMNAIIGMTEILEENNLTAEQKECVNAIKISSNNLLSIINDILDFSKIESGKIEFVNRPVNLKNLIEGIVQTLHFTVNRKSITLGYNISENIPLFIMGDEVRLRQILLNLCGNSIKFTEKGSVKIDVKLKEKQNNYYTLLFTVSDTGIGIPADKISTIFESFVQASGDTTRKYGGTGLGLTITKQLVELQGGSIFVKSKINEGTQFQFELTFKKAEAEQLEEESESIIDYTGLKGVKILLAEDNNMNQILAKKILNEWNVYYDIAGNGKIAIEKLLETNYDVILMDMHMPEMDGYTAVEHIRTKMPASKSGIPIIAVTANALKGEEEKCLALGMNDYISKPLRKKTLYQKILKVLEKADGHVFKETKKETTENTVGYSDLSYLKQIAEGNTEFIKEMINFFIADLPNTLSEMDNTLAQKKWPELKIIAHTLKSSADFMGIHSIKETLRNIENFAEAKTNLELLPELIAKTKNHCTKAAEELNNEIKKFI